MKDQSKNQIGYPSIIVLAVSVFLVLLMSRMTSPIAEYSDGFDYIYNGQNLLNPSLTVANGLPERVSVGVISSKNFFMPAPLFSILSAKLYSTFGESFLPLSIISFILILVALFFTFLTVKQLSGNERVAGLVVLLLSFLPIIQKECIRPTGDSILFCFVQICIWLLLQQFSTFYVGLLLGVIYFFRTHTLLLLLLMPILFIDLSQPRVFLKNIFKMLGGFALVYITLAIVLKLLTSPPPEASNAIDNSLQFYYTVFSQFFSEVNRSLYIDTLFRTFDECFSWQMLTPVAILGFLPGLLIKKSNHSGLHIQNLSLFAWVGLVFQILLMATHYNVEHRYYIYYIPALATAGAVIVSQLVNNQEQWKKNLSLPGGIILISFLILAIIIPGYRKIRFANFESIAKNIKNSDLPCSTLSELGKKSDGAVLTNSRFLGRCLGFKKNYPIPGTIHLSEFLSADNSQVSAFSMVIPNHPVEEMDDWQKLVFLQESFTDNQGIRFVRKIFEIRPKMIFVLFLKDTK